MTTRRQIVLLVMPLFVGLAAIGGSLMAWLQLRTAERDFRTEVETAAIAIAEFLPATAFDPVVAGRPLAEAQALSVFFERIQRWRQVERIFLVNGSGQVLADTLRGAPLDPAFLAQAPVPDRPVVLGPVTPADDPRQVRPALIASQREGIRIGIEVTAETYRRQRTLVFRRVLVLCLFTLAVGLAVSLVLAAFVSWQFNRLSRLAGLVGDGRFDRAEQTAAIQEVADVGSILGVMHSVLVETLEKTRRSLIDREYVRSDQALARVLRERTLPPSRWSCAGAEGVFISVGSPPALQGTVEIDATTGAAFNGLLASEGGLDCALRARAASEHLVNALRAVALADAGASTCALFQLSELVIVRWSGDRLEEWHHRGTDAPLMVGGTFSSDHPVVLSCIAPDDRVRLAVYLRTYPNAPLDRLAADLPAVLAGSRPGNVLALRRSST